MKKNLLKVKTPIYHLCFWAICGYLFPHVLNVPLFNVAIFMAGIIIGTYTIGYFLMPRFFNRQYVGIFVLSVIVLLFVIAWTSGRLIHSKNGIFIYGLFYFAFFFLAICTIAIWNGYQNSLKIKNLQKLQTETELNFLKAQVNPHFLFNTLNNLYATARVESPTTASGLIKLADLMRYMFTKANQEAVLLSEEIAYLDNYIDLEKMRLNEGAHISFLKKGDFSDKKIAPMLLLPFVENAFKHGVEKQLDNIFVEINLSLQGNILYFQVENNKQFEDKHPLSIGSGLENVKKRFAIGYPNQHGIDILETKEKFSVKLWINL
jgi:two-component system, LytTR family, sensor kinase